MPVIRASTLPFILLLAGCADGAPAPLAAAPSPAPVVKVAMRASATITGQPLALPPSPWEAVISTSVLPAGGGLPMHKHPWPRYAFVESGRLEVRYEATGLVRTFGPGDAVVEAVDQWHEGRVVGDEPVRLVVFDQLPPGQTNVVRR
jgi:quercetin dioxygenase-like cupin family protein